MSRLLHLRPHPADLEVVGTENEAPAAVEDDSRQLTLFSDAAVLARGLEHAVATGHFDEARRLRQKALETWGVGGLAQEFAFVDGLGPALWERPSGEILARWQDLDVGLDGRPSLQAKLREGVFRRLFEQHDAAALAGERPDLAGPLCAVLSAADDAQGAATARALIRDLLLEGCVLDAAAFSHDASAADLLAQDLSPGWLACLGALRHLWPASSLSPGEVDAFGRRPFVPPSSGAAAARDFWTCLRAARTAEVPEAALHEARRRMKRLNPDLHALLMGSRGPCAARTRA